ncbi:MAG: hypothetical protein ACTHLE_04395 [Agriterribacter sp.]
MNYSRFELNRKPEVGDRIIVGFFDHVYFWGRYYTALDKHLGSFKYGSKSNPSKLHNHDR